MFTLIASWRPRRYLPPIQIRSWLTALGRLAIALAMAVLMLQSLAPRTMHAAGTPLAPPVFPGPQHGPAGTSTPTPQDFSYQCTTGISTAPIHAAGITLAAGDAIRSEGCGEATLLLNSPATGHFKATFAVADGAPAGSHAQIQLLVLGPGGFNIHSSFAQATTGSAVQIDVDVSEGAALTLTYPTQSITVVYHMTLTGQARVARRIPLPSIVMPAGAMPVPPGAISTSCNANKLTAQGTVSGLLVPAAGSFQLGGCGTITVSLTAAAGPTLAVRFGADETLTPYTAIPAQMTLRVLDASGHLLRKAIALAYSGSGLQALWVDTRGGSTATLIDDGGSHEVATGFSFLPAHYAAHPNPDHEGFGSPSGSPVDVSPDAMVNNCNATIGNAVTTVAHHNLPRESYIVMGGCGTSELVMTNAHGRFQARFGIIDTSSTANLKHSATLIVLDQNSHPLVQISVTAKFGAPGAVLSASVDGGSILEVQASGGAEAALYDMTLTGHATLYDRIFPPSEPPVSTPGGTPVDPRAFTLNCNLRVADHDTLLVHQAALEQWSLSGGGCGTATLNLTALHGPHHLFSALYGLTVVDQHYGIGHVHLTLLDAAGKVMRTGQGTTRAGYGPRRLSISLDGGVKLQITWDDFPLTVYALTTA